MLDNRGCSAGGAVVRKKAVPYPSQARRVLNNLMGTLGVCVALVSVLFLVMFVGELIWGSKTEPPVLVALVIFFLGTGAAGAILARNCFRARAGSSAPVLSEFDREQRILDRAKAVGGRLTVAEVAADCDLGLEDSKRILDHFVVNGAAEMLVTDDGILVYRFPGFLSTERKARARDL